MVCAQVCVHACVRVHTCVMGVKCKPRKLHMERLLRQRSTLAYLTTQNTHMTEAWWKNQKNGRDEAWGMILKIKEAGGPGYVGGRTNILI